jgi:anaerobic selenocysteine-containing dehydrogenase
MTVNRRNFLKLTTAAATAVGTGYASTGSAAGAEGSVHTTDFSEWV